MGGTANLEAPTSQNFKQGLLVLVACHPLNFFLIKEEIKEWNPKAKFVFFLKKKGARPRTFNSGEARLHGLVCFFNLMLFFKN